MNIIPRWYPKEYHCPRNIRLERICIQGQERWQKEEVEGPEKTPLQLLPGLKGNNTYVQGGHTGKPVSVYFARINFQSSCLGIRVLRLWQPWLAFSREISVSMCHRTSSLSLWPLLPKLEKLTSSGSFLSLSMSSSFQPGNSNVHRILAGALK